MHVCCVHAAQVVVERFRLVASLLNDSLDRLHIAVKVYGVAITKHRVAATVTTLIVSVVLHYVSRAAHEVGL